MKKGDDVADDQDDEVRTSVPQDRVTVTLCTEGSISGLSIYSSLHTSDRSNVEGGGYGSPTKVKVKIVKNAESKKRRTTKRQKTKRRMGQKVEWKKRRKGQNVE
jgi:hypothetical protein